MKIFIDWYMEDKVFYSTISIFITKAYKLLKNKLWRK